MKIIVVGLLVVGMSLAASAVWAGGHDHRSSRDRTHANVYPTRHVASSYRSCAPVYVRQPVYYNRSVFAPRMMPQPRYRGWSQGGYHSYQRVGYPGRSYYAAQPGTVVVISYW